MRHAKRVSKLESANGGRRRIEELKMDALVDQAQTGDVQALEDCIDMLQARCARYLDEAPAIRSRILAEIEGAPPELIDAYEAAHARQVRVMRMLTGQEPPDKDFITRTPAVFETVLARVESFIESRGFYSFAHEVWLGLPGIVDGCSNCMPRLPGCTFDEWWGQITQPGTAVA